MRKLLSIILILLFLFSLTSCKKENGKNKTSSTEAHTVTVTFPEGITVAEAAQKLQENGVCNANEFITLSNDISFLKALGYSFLKGIDKATKRPFVLEGYIFPDTYEFYLGENPETALKRFLDNTEIKLNADYNERAKLLGYSMDEILTLASVIQEEASEHRYMADVSSVLHNRLKRDYNYLECDVTVHYIRNNVENSPYISYSTDKASKYYNTYEKRGLPLGPICNPGIKAIEAALYPAVTPYYYFVTDEEWNYYFSETWEEHNARCHELGVY